MGSLHYNFSGVKNLDPVSWQKLGEYSHDDSILARQAALGELEKSIAETQRRPPCNNIVLSRELRSREGYYDPTTNDMYISMADVEGNVSPHEAVNSVAHEGRHAYQHHVTTNPEAHPEVSQSNKGRWSNNLEPGNYIRPSPDTMKGYLGQPVEIDSRQLAGLVEYQLCGERQENARSAAQSTSDAKETDKPGDNSLAQAKAELKASLNSDRPPDVQPKAAEPNKAVERETPAPPSVASSEDAAPEKLQASESQSGDKTLAELKAEMKASLKEDRPPPPPPPPPSQGSGFSM